MDKHQKEISVSFVILRNESEQTRTHLSNITNDLKDEEENATHGKDIPFVYGTGIDGDDDPK